MQLQTWMSQRYEAYNLVFFFLFFDLCAQFTGFVQEISKLLEPWVTPSPYVQVACSSLSYADIALACSYKMCT